MLAGDQHSLTSILERDDKFDELLAWLVSRMQATNVRQDGQRGDDSVISLQRKWRAKGILFTSKQYTEKPSNCHRARSWSRNVRAIWTVECCQGTFPAVCSFLWWRMLAKIDSQNRDRAWIVIDWVRMLNKIACGCKSKVTVVSCSCATKKDLGNIEYERNYNLQTAKM